MTCGPDRCVNGEPTRADGFNGGRARDIMSPKILRAAHAISGPGDDRAGMPMALRSGSWVLSDYPFGGPCGHRGTTRPRP